MLDERPARSARVALHCLLVADRRLIWVLAELPPGAPLPEQIPAWVEGDLEAPQLLAVRVGRRAARFPVEQLMLLAGKLVDSIDDLVVSHGIPPWTVPAGATSSTARLSPG